MAKALAAVLARLLYYIDYAQMWQKTMIRHASKLLELHSIKNVMVTGGPFTPMAFAVPLKRKYPDINLILDFRDPWPAVVGPFRSYRQRASLRYERDAIYHADTVIFTTESLLESYKASYPNCEDKFCAIYNGYDKDDIPVTLPEETGVSDHISIIYAGTLYGGREEAILLITRAILQLEEMQNDVLPLRFEMYCEHFNEPIFSHEEALAFKRYFTFHKYLGQSELLIELLQHEYCLSINSKTLPHLIGAKTYDYLGMGQRIIQIGPEGCELNTILQDLGHLVASYDRNEVAMVLNKLTNRHDTWSIRSNVEHFSINNLVLELESKFI